MGLFFVFTSEGFLAIFYHQQRDRHVKFMQACGMISNLSGVKYMISAVLDQQN